MAFLPKIEKITRDAVITHFLLMFGYKVFSLYFPLFLVIKGFSLPQVGYTYLLIYLPLALSTSIVGFLNHRINPAVLATVGISGYGIYALGMILIENPLLFYLWQVLLGISAALFFVSARSILIGSSLENPDRAFGWFYSAPYYADAFAPAVGAILIWKLDFFGVFISFSVLLLAGFYRAFFVLFLKEELFWSQNFILIFTSVFSLLFLPLSLLIIQHLGRFRSEKNIFQGGIVDGLFSILFGVAIPILSFFSVLIINVGRAMGSLTCSSGRSGLISDKLKEYPEEAGAIDTIFAPLGGALGSFIAGLIIGFLGYGNTFIFGGLFVIIVTCLSMIFVKK